MPQPSESAESTCLGSSLRAKGHAARRLRAALTGRARRPVASDRLGRNTIQTLLRAALCRVKRTVTETVR